MSDMETRLVARLKRVVEFDADSDMSLKFACLGAETVVGKYDGSTREIAKHRKRSVSTIENWAHAARLYKELRGDPVYFFRARRLWRTLRASHWWLAYDIQVAGYDAMIYLINADLHGWSGRDMLGNFKAEREAGHAPLQFARLKTGLCGLLEEALTKHKDSLTPQQASALEAAWEVMG